MAPVELSMQQLAQIALGSPQMTNVNITILHSLIDLILKKLNCQNETVSIGGMESKCLEKILNNTKASPIAFNDENMEILSEKLNRVVALEERIKCVDTKLERHFEEIRRCNNAEMNSFTYRNWESYSNTCEDLCVVCDPENEIACNLIQNADFMKKLLRRISKPVVDRVFDLERRIELLHYEFTEFLKRAEEQYKKIALIEKCISEIEGLRKTINDHHVQFLSTMEEIQDMLDAKLDKIHIPSLKKYIRERFEEIEAALKKLQEFRDCPKAAGVVMGAIKCLSCGANKVCAEIGVHTTGILPNMQPGKVTDPQKPTKHCGCTGLCLAETTEPGLMKRIQLMDLKVNAELLVAKEEGAKRRRRSCKFGKNSIKEQTLMLGTDGNFYRSE